MSFASMLNKTCSVEKAVLSENAATGEKIYVWEEVYPGVKCRMRNRTFSEKISGGIEYQNSAHALYLRYLPLDKKTHRIILGGKAYKISGNIDLGGEGEYLCLYLEEWQ